MPRLSDLLSDNSDREKLASLADRGRGRKNAGGRKGAPSGQMAKPGPSLRDRQDAVMSSFVALDCETTGLDYKNDRIIEIGAVSFVDGKIAGTYSSFVNPGIPIPAHVTELTGICERDVAAAPDFSAIAPAVLDFIRTQPICGHQIEFDISFINEAFKRQNGALLANETLDTAQLSRLVLMNLPGYSLGLVATHLGIALVNAHRATDDARASGFIAVSLLPQLREIPLKSRRLMINFAPRSLLKTALIQSLACGENPCEEKQAPEKSPRQPKLELDAPLKELSEPEMEAIFAPDGPLSKSIDGYAPRESQIAMARSVTRMFNEKTFLAAEAGTGTGKSLAYLVPAARIAVASNSRILVSTHTRNLQDQLANKDLPMIAGVIGDHLRFTVLKGRANYLCRLGYRNLLSGALGNLSPRERAGLMPLIRWAEQTHTGDIEEQRQFNRRWFAKVWNLISAESHDCRGPRCPCFTECFLQRARRRALSSHIVIINHSLFFSEACAESSFLGPLGAVIFDEAHHLESSGHRSLRVTVDTNRINLFAETGIGLTKKCQKVDTDTFAGYAGALKKTLKMIRKNAQNFLGDLTVWAAQSRPDIAEYQIAYHENTFEDLVSLAGLTLALNELQDILLAIHRTLIEQEEFPGCDELKADTLSLSGRTSQIRADLRYLCGAVTEDHAFWIEGNRQKGWVKLCGVPLDIGSFLASLWERSREAVLFTSATLSVGGSMDFFLRKTGLFGPNESRTQWRCFKSPFSPSQAIRAAIRSAPNPTDPAFARVCADTLIALHAAFKKNILVLFTANAMLHDVDKMVRQSPLIRQGAVFTQGTDGSRHLLFQQFKQAGHALLLGTGSFWEGIDAPGETCEIVVIPRLPFAVPTDPLTQALAQRMERLNGESFFSYSVPEAVIRFRQGAGRLIRTPSDRGALVILDNRIVTKNYGKLFARSLDGTVQAFDGRDALIGALSYFFRHETPPEETVTYVPFEDL